MDSYVSFITPSMGASVEDAKSIFDLSNKSGLEHEFIKLKKMYNIFIIRNHIVYLNQKES